MNYFRTTSACGTLEQKVGRDPRVYLVQENEVILKPLIQKLSEFYPLTGVVRLSFR